MADQNDEHKVIKKVQPYPFPILLHRDGQVLNGQVLKLAQKGAIIETGQVILTVASEFSVSFEIPVHKVAMTLPVKVIKTYDRALPTGKGVEHLAEVHFLKIGTDQIRAIYNFMVAIRQVKP